MSKYSKRDYEVFAFLLKNSETKDDVVNNMCNYFTIDNDRFNKEKFLEAIK